MHPFRAIPLLLAIVATAVLSQSCSTPHFRSIAARDRQELQAASPDGRQLALVRNGLALIDRISGKSFQLDPKSPVVVAWRHDGGRLAAGFLDDKEDGRLVVFDRTGQRLEEHPLPGRILTVAWSSRNDLLIAGYRLQEFSFGANLSQWLVRIDGQKREQIALGDVTLKPGTATRLKGSLPELLSVVFTPAGDELAFLHLSDPPQFPPYLRLLYRNWQVPTERRLLDLPVQPARLAWLKGGETITYRSGDNDLRQIALWPTAASSFPDHHSSTERAVREDDQSMWTLRRWRFEGLITPDEFRATIGRMQP